MVLVVIIPSLLQVYILKTHRSLILDVLFYVVKCVRRTQPSETIRRILNMNPARAVTWDTRFMTEQIQNNSMAAERVKISKILLISV